MRKTFLPFVFFLFLAAAAFAQAPQGFNYQGIARNATGNPYVNQAMALRLTIHDISAAGTVVYQETHSVTTNAYGLYNVMVGSGTVTAGNFSTINWGTGNKFMQVEVDTANGTNFATLGASQLMSVPYAVYANTAGTATNAQNLLGTVPMNGDVTGTNTATTVVKLQNRNLASTAPTAGQVLAWNSVSNTWEPSSTGGGTVTTVTPGIGLTSTPNPIVTSGTIDLANTGVTAGSYGSATSVPVFNVDPQGRITGVVNTPIVVAGSGTVTSLTASTGIQLSPNPITTAGTIGLTNTGVTPGSYGTATTVPQIAVDAQGRITSASNVTITTSSASGTVNYISKFTAPTALGNSDMYQDPTTGDVGLGTIAPIATFEAKSTTDSMSGHFVTSTTNPTLNKGIFEVDYAGPVDGPIGFVSNAYNSTTNNATWGAQVIGSSIGALGVGITELTGGVAATRGAEGDGYCDDVYSMGVGGYANPNIGFPSSCYGIVGNATGGVVNYSGYFIGDVFVGGMLSKGGGTFKIDDPLDPANKYLYHSFVESPDMMNIYNGNTTTDATGTAEVTLPAYFDALNKDFRYQLTVIGSFAQAMVSKEISGNTFEIKTSTPNVKVSWQVTGVRKDAFANAHRVVPEVEKESFNKGKYLHPKELGQPENKMIGDEIAHPMGKSKGILTHNHKAAQNNQK